MKATSKSSATANRRGSGNPCAVIRSIVVMMAPLGRSLRQSWMPKFRETVDSDQTGRGPEQRLSGWRSLRSQEAGWAPEEAMKSVWQGFFPPAEWLAEY